MLSEYLPGRNLACFLLYHEGKLLKYGVAERIEYLMAKVCSIKNYRKYEQRQTT